MPPSVINHCTVIFNSAGAILKGNQLINTYLHSSINCSKNVSNRLLKEMVSLETMRQGMINGGEVKLFQPPYLQNVKTVNMGFDE